MNFGSSLLNEFVRMRKAIDEATPISEVKVDEVITLSPEKKLKKVRKAIKDIKKNPSDPEVKALIDSDPNRKAVELFFLNKLLKLITTDA